MTNPLIIQRSTPAAEDTTQPRGQARNKPEWAGRIAQVLTGALGLFLISSGVAKFGGGHLFQYIEHQSGIDLFHPFSNLVVGTAEVVAGTLVLFRRTRLVGAAIASSVMIGAVAFHLSPWLGVSVPTGLAEGASAPWSADDFVGTTTVAPFAMAIVTCLGSLLVMRSAWRARARAGTAEAGPTAKRAGRAAAA